VCGYRGQETRSQRIKALWYWEIQLPNPSSRSASRSFVASCRRVLSRWALKHGQKRYITNTGIVDDKIMPIEKRSAITPFMIDIVLVV
jgi:hypothetical protein